MLDQVLRSPRDRLLTVVEQLLAAQPSTADITVDAPLSEIGLSSINMVNLMLTVEAEFDVMIPQSDITPDNFRSIASIERLLSKLCSQGSDRCN